MFGKGSLRTIWKHYVQCASDQSDDENCNRGRWKYASRGCTHHRDAGVICLTKGSILLNKPSVMSASAMTEVQTSSKANDGLWALSMSSTNFTQNPYWQGDMKGDFMVESITVTSWGGQRVRNATVRVSADKMIYPDGKMVECGQWPNKILHDYSITFKCQLTAPVRYVTIQRKGDNLQLELMEVHVEERTSSISGAYCDRNVATKVATQTTSTTAVSLIGCGISCSTNQPCTMFSYNTTQNLNCLLVTDVAMETDPNWKRGNAKSFIYIRTRELYQLYCNNTGR